jgi:RNA polymerase sigma factor (sigma-70 family)
VSACVRGVGDPGLASETPLFLQAQAGCRLSLSQLMHRHDGLVQAVVRQQVLGTLPFAEALQAGRIGLWRAIVGFDPQRRVAFSTYAWPCIMRRVWQAVNTHARQQAAPVAPMPPALIAPADPAVLAEALAVQDTLYAQVSHLPERLRQVIVAHYGLDGDPPVSYRRLGARLRLSHERIRQLHTEALVWLRHPAHSHALRSLLQRHSLADYLAADALAQSWLQHRGGRRGG